MLRCLSVSKWTDAQSHPAEARAEAKTYPSACVCVCVRVCARSNLLVGTNPLTLPVAFVTCRPREFRAVYMQAHGDTLVSDMLEK